MTEETYPEPEATYFVLRDAGDGLTNLKFHLASGDYFATMDTVLGFAEESIARHESETPLAGAELGAIRKIRADLKHLHKHYAIVEKQDAGA